MKHVNRSSLTRLQVHTFCSDDLLKDSTHLIQASEKIRRVLHFLSGTNLAVLTQGLSFFHVLQEDCTWNSIEGRKVQLTNTPLSALSVPECIALQRVAQTRLKQLNLKCHVTIPKGMKAQ